MGWLEKRLSGPGLGSVLVANRCHGADLPHAPERLGSNIGTTRMVAQIFAQQFFPPVRSREARLDRYLRNGEVPSSNISNSKMGLLRKRNLVFQTRGPFPAASPRRPYNQ